MSDSLLNIIVNELKKYKLCAENVDITPIKALLDKIDPKVISKISDKIPIVIISHLKNILQDNKIDLSDTSEILELLKDLYTSIGELNNENSFKISSKQLVDIVMIIINAILSLCIEDKDKLNLLVKIIETSGTFLLFSLPEKISLFCKCCKNF